MLLTII